MLKHLWGRRAEKLLRSGFKKNKKKKQQYILVAVIKMKKNVNSKFGFCFFRPGCKFCSTDVPWRRHRGSIVKLWEAALMKPAACGELDGRRWEAHVLCQFILFSFFFTSLKVQKHALSLMLNKMPARPTVRLSITSGCSNWCSALSCCYCTLPHICNSLVEHGVPNH